MRKALHDVVRPELTNPYPIDVLDGVVAALDTLGRSWAEIPAYLRWDAEATAVILRRLDLTPPPPPVRHMEEFPHSRDRIERFPFNQLTPRRR